MIYEIRYRIYLIKKFIIRINRKVKHYMSRRYYKVIKENFLWETGAILEQREGMDGYTPIDDAFCKDENNKEYITSQIVESQSEYFQRVYPVHLLKKIVYKVKEEAKEMLKKNYEDQ